MGMGVGIILLHLEQMTLGSDEVDGNGPLSLTATSVDGDSSGTGTWMTPAMGTWGVPLSLMKLKPVLWLDEMVWRREGCIKAEMWWPSKAHLIS